MDVGGRGETGGVKHRVDAQDVMDQAEGVPRLGGEVGAYCVQKADRVGNGVSQGERFFGRGVSEGVVVVAPPRVAEVTAWSGGLVLLSTGEGSRR